MSRPMLKGLLIALAVTVGVIALLVGLLRRLNPPPPRNDGENAG